jgi:hypothetical protein
MNQTKQPSKEHIRQWLRDRQLNPGPLPTMEQIKSELGWTSGRSREVFKEAVATAKCFDDQSIDAILAAIRVKEIMQYGHPAETPMDEGRGYNGCMPQRIRTFLPTKDRPCYRHFVMRGNACALGPP